MKRMRRARASQKFREIALRVCVQCTHSVYRCPQTSPNLIAAYGCGRLSKLAERNQTHRARPDRTRGHFSAVDRERERPRDCGKVSASSARPAAVRRVVGQFQISRRQLMQLASRDVFAPNGSAAIVSVISPCCAPKPHRGQGLKNTRPEKLSAGRLGGLNVEMRTEPKNASTLNGLSHQNRSGSFAPRNGSALRDTTPN